MNIKEFAKSRNLTLAVTRQLCKSLLNKTPQVLLKEEVDRLDKALANTARALTAGEEDSPVIEEEVEASIAPVDNATIEATKTIVGEDILKTNVLLYLSYLKTQILEYKYQIDSQAFQTEQSIYNHLGHYQRNLYEDGKARINNNIQNALGLFSPYTLQEELATKKETIDASLYKDALELLQMLGE